MHQPTVPGARALAARGRRTGRLLQQLRRSTAQRSAAARAAAALAAAPTERVPAIRAPAIARLVAGSGSSPSPPVQPSSQEPSLACTPQSRLLTKKKDAPDSLGALQSTQSVSENGSRTRASVCRPKGAAHKKRAAGGGTGRSWAWGDGGYSVDRSSREASGRPTTFKTGRTAHRNKLAAPEVAPISGHGAILRAAKAAVDSPVGPFPGYGSTGGKGFRR